MGVFADFREGIEKAEAINPEITQLQKVAMGVFNVLGVHLMSTNEAEYHRMPKIDSIEMAWDDGILISPEGLQYNLEQYRRAK